MTIYRQQSALIIVLLLSVFAGTMVTDLRHTRSFLEAQLHSHAQDAASSLGLSLSPHMAAGEIPSIVSMTDAIFDGGYYRSIVVEDMQGDIITERHVMVDLEDVPGWFTRTLTLQTPQKQAIIMDGWNQAGIVRVVSHPGHAYRQLWDSLTGKLGWISLGALVAIIAGIALLRLTLKPMTEVEQQAEAICRREFPVVTKQPKTRELANIVAAMNKLSSKVKHMLDDLEELVTSFRGKAFEHPVTGLPNRRRFQDILAEKIASEEECHQALLCLIELQDFKSYNNKYGFVKADQLLQETSAQLNKILPETAKTVLGHLTGATFVVLVENCTKAEAEELGEQLIGTLHNLRETGMTKADDIGHVGIAQFDGSQNPSQLLSDADAALRDAQLSAVNGWKYYSSSSEGRPARSASKWREFIQQAVAEKRLRLMFQSVVSVPDRDLHHREVLVRIVELDADGNESLVPAGIFIPMAASLELTAQIDRHVLENVIEHLEREDRLGMTVAINLSAASFRHADFTDWIIDSLRDHPEAARRIFFEMPEFSVKPLLQEIRSFVEKLASVGGRFGLDHVGSNNGMFSYLRSFRADYVKIDGSFFRGLEDNGDHQFLIQTLAEIAHGLDMAVIAESVENEEVWDLLQGLNIDAAQGYFIGRPELDDTQA